MDDLGILKQIEKDYNIHFNKEYVISSSREIKNEASYSIYQDRIIGLKITGYKDIKIEDLTNKIKSFNNLTALVLDGIGIKDISFLTNFPNLTYFSISKNQIKDFSFIKYCPNLEILNIEENNINDISWVEALSNHKNLITLNIGSNNISNISPLESIKWINSISLCKNNISDISALAELKNLEYLYLSGNKIQDISALAELKNLEYLDLSGNEITQISSLLNFKLLSKLELQNNPLLVDEVVNFINQYRNERKQDTSYNFGENKDYNELTYRLFSDGNKKVEIKDKNFKNLTFCNKLKVETIFLPKIKITEAVKHVDLLNTFNNVSIFFEENGQNAKNEIYNNCFNIITFKKESTTVNSSCNNYTEIPDFHKIKNLESLNLNNNKISDISALKKYKHLKRIELNNNEIKDISVIAELKAENINLVNNRINKRNNIINTVNALNHKCSLNLNNNIYKNFYIDILEDGSKEINLSNNELSDVSFLSEIENISILDLEGNNISDLSFLEGKASLQELILKDNSISDISVLYNLHNLKHLDISKNSISDINQIIHLINTFNKDGNFLFSTKEIHNIKLSIQENVAKVLDLSGNKLKDISFINNLEDITYLDLSNNEISDISPLKAHKNLRFNLSNNLINKIDRDFFTNFKNINEWQWKKILDKNPLNNPPLEIIEQGNIAINNWFESERVLNNEIKVVILGNSGVGKTSFVNYLQNKSFNNVSSTHGINLDKWNTEIDAPFWRKQNHEKENIVVKFWDFGGQEYYHATHRLFLTDNSFYILMWSNEKKNNIEYWLKLIREKYAPQAEIIIIQNKTDKIEAKKVISQEIIDKYNIKEQYHISIQEAYDGNKRAITKFNGFLKDFNDFIAKRIFEIQKYTQIIKTDIQYWEDNYILKKDFFEKVEKILKENNVDLKEYKPTVLFEYLQKNSSIIYYGDNKEFEKSKIKDYVFIKPQFLTETIYKILNERVKDEKGKFDFEHVRKVVEDDKKAKIFIELMQAPKFELIFNHPNEENKFLAPQYLPEKIEDEQGFLKDILKDFEISFVLKITGFFSKSFMWRFISNNGHLSKKNNFANQEIYFTKNDINIYIESNIGEQKIFIKTKSKNKRSNVTKEIFKEFKEIIGNENSIEISLDNENFKSFVEIQRENDTKYFYLLDIYIDDFSQKILNELVETLETIKDNPKGYIENKNEPEINKHLADIFRIEGLKLEAEHEGGISQTGKSTGNIDIAIFDNNAKISIIEALKHHDKKD